MQWLIKLRNWVEGSHTPSREERWHSRTTQPYKGQNCPCGAPATGIYQLQTQSRMETFYTCAKHMGITRWVPNPDDPGLWF